ncbi:TPA: hypothetical protein ACGSAY_003525 [Yersinia enterocolitica]|nr:hypothetical protein [Yersinia enterocolitica]EKN4737508.1 hypothetical protein [Yersinia enterocolitica]ELY5236216.1 hypothetical protein [Yersinia enterocolitica]ELZ9064719.1 hypothetical protein [Yersinia enterocolitica]
MARLTNDPGPPGQLSNVPNAVLPPAGPLPKIPTPPEPITTETPLLNPVVNDANAYAPLLPGTVIPPCPAPVAESDPDAPPPPTASTSIYAVPVVGV